LSNGRTNKVTCIAFAKSDSISSYKTLTTLSNRAKAMRLAHGVRFWYQILRLENLRNAKALLRWSGGFSEREVVSSLHAEFLLEATPLFELPMEVNGPS
jgi:hypothetical protein